MFLKELGNKKGSSKATFWQGWGPAENWGLRGIGILGRGWCGLWRHVFLDLEGGG